MQRSQLGRWGKLASCPKIKVEGHSSHSAAGPCLQTKAWPSPSLKATSIKQNRHMCSESGSSSTTGNSPSPARQGHACQSCSRDVPGLWEPQRGQAACSTPGLAPPAPVQKGRTGMGMGGRSRPDCSKSPQAGRKLCAAGWLVSSSTFAYPSDFSEVCKQQSPVESGAQVPPVPPKNLYG